MKSRDITIIGLFVALMAAGAFISIPVGPVPISLQTFFVLISIGYLKEKSVWVHITYVLLGLIGMPIFTGGAGGVGSVFLPSFGFLLSFIIVSFIMGNIMKNKNLDYKGYLIYYSIATVLIYLIGMSYMAFILNVYLGKGLTIYQLLMAGMIVFLPGDLVKILVGSLVSTRLDKLL